MIYKKHIYHANGVELLVRLDINCEVKRLIALLVILLSPEDKSLCPPAVGLLILGGPDLGHLRAQFLQDTNICIYLIVYINIQIKKEIK